LTHTERQDLRDVMRLLFAAYVDADTKQRLRVLEIVVIEGRSARDAAQDTGMSKSSVHRLVNDFVRACETQNPDLLRVALEAADAG